MIMSEQKKIYDSFIKIVQVHLQTQIRKYINIGIKVLKLHETKLFKNKKV